MNLNGIAVDAFYSMYGETELSIHLMERRPFTDWQDVQNRTKIKYAQIEEMQKRGFTIAPVPHKKAMTTDNSMAFMRNADPEKQNVLNRDKFRLP